MSDTHRQVSEREKAQAALTYVDANCDRKTWSRIAAALKDEFGEDGFDLFDDWSSKGDRYDPSAARSTWKSMKSGKGISIASLYHEAKAYGFKPFEWKTQAPLNQDEYVKRAAERAAAQAAQEAEDARKHAEVAAKATEVFQHGEALTSDHPYIQRKRLTEHPWLMDKAVAPRELSADKLAKLIGYRPKANEIPLSGRVLMIPMINGNNITTLEFIGEHGRKTALGGGLKKSSWSTPVPMGRHLASHPTTPNVIVEGWATAYSTQHPFLRAPGEMPSAYVVAAGADTNLGNVARALRQQHPIAPIVIGADIGNPNSMELAEAAARTVGGAVMAPQFTDEQLQFLTSHLGKAPTDFNDQFVYYKANQLPLDEFDKDIAYAFELARYPDPAPTADASRTSAATFSAHEAHSSKGDRTVEKSTEEMPATANHVPAAPDNKQPREPGKSLYDIKDVPLEIRDAAQGVFGKRHTLYTPRENGGPYNGEVYNTRDYLIQEVGPRSLVIHDKSKLEFANDRLKWMDENQRLNGHELSVFYKGDEAKAYPFDRLRDELDRAVGSFKKSAKELGLDPAFAEQLDQTFKQSITRIHGLRKEAQEQAKAKNVATPAPEESLAGPKR